jgi:hypothetical protein
VTCKRPQSLPSLVMSHGPRRRIETSQSYFSPFSTGKVPSSPIAKLSLLFLERSPCKQGNALVPLLHLCPPGPRDARSHDLQFEAERNKNTARKLRTRDPLSRSDALAPRRQ